MQQSFEAVETAYPVIQDSTNYLNADIFSSIAAYLFDKCTSYPCTDSLINMKTDVWVQILLVEAGVITLYTVAHLQADIVIIYSVIHISPFTNYDVL